MNAQVAAEQTAPQNITQLPAVATPRKQDIRVVNDPIPILDTARFEHMQRIATIMARSNLIPESLTTFGPKEKKENLPIEAIIANCFLVVNQAVRWNMDPFAVAQCVSVVHGKLCYEGKLIAGVIEEKLGIRLRYSWDEKPGDALGITVSGTFPDGVTESLKGTVGDWKTTGAGTPWTPKQSRKMLAYRGAREWCRLFAPGLMLGIYSDDEFDNLSDENRGRRARDVTPPRDDGPPPPSAVQAITHQPQEQTEADDADLKQAPDLVPGEIMDPATGEVTWTDPPPADDDGIPGFLQRDPKAAAAHEDEKAWLTDLEGAFSGCEDMVSFGEKQRAIMAPQKGKVSVEAWTRAQHLAEDTFKRITMAG